MADRGLGPYFFFLAFSLERQRQGGRRFKNEQIFSVGIYRMRAALSSKWKLNKFAVGVSFLSREGSDRPIFYFHLICNFHINVKGHVLYQKQFCENFREHSSISLNQQLFNLFALFEGSLMGSLVHDDLYTKINRFRLE